MQHDYNIENQTAISFRSDLNDALGAIVTSNSGSEPTTTFANMMWYDTDNSLLKMRDEANSGWVSLGFIDQVNSVFRPFIGTTQVGGFTDTDTLTPQGSTIIPSNRSVKAYVDNTIEDVSLGYNQTWQDVSASRVVDTSYQNSTGRPIVASVTISATDNYDFEVSTDNSTWVVVGTLGGFGNIRDLKSAQVIIPAGNYYRVGGGTVYSWAELK